MTCNDVIQIFIKTTRYSNLNLGGHLTLTSLSMLNSILSSSTFNNISNLHPSSDSSFIQWLKTIGSLTYSEINFNHICNLLLGISSRSNKMTFLSCCSHSLRWRSARSSRNNVVFNIKKMEIIFQIKLIIEFYSG